MSSTPRTEPNDRESGEDLGGISTAMMRHARRIQEALGNEACDIRPRLSVIPPTSEEEETRISSAEIRKITAYVKAHRRRDLLFAPALFGDPAWDMLLDLFVARGESRLVSMDSVCLAAGVPASTAWRKFAALEDAGLVERQMDPDDGRRTHIAVTGSGVVRIRHWLNQLEACETSAG